MLSASGSASPQRSSAAVNHLTFSIKLGNPIRGVQYVRERFFKGGEFKDLTHLRNEAARWCRDVAGRRIHGTTRRQPLQVFLDEERPALAPWDGEPYEVTHWRTAKVHPDHHVACQYALYSVPSTLCPPGQQVEIGLGLKLVRIYHRGRLVKVHPHGPRTPTNAQIRAVTHYPGGTLSLRHSGMFCRRP